MTASSEKCNLHPCLQVERGRVRDVDPLGARDHCGGGVQVGEADGTTLQTGGQY